MPSADIRAWLKKMRPKWSRSGKTSAWSGRKAPPESTRYRQGTVLLGDLLGAEVLLDGHREVGAALDRRVVCDDHALAPLHDADARDETRRGRLPVVHVPGGERVELQERAAGIDQPVDALARGQLAAA